MPFWIEILKFKNIKYFISKSYFELNFKKYNPIIIKK